MLLSCEGGSFPSEGTGAKACDSSNGKCRDGKEAPLASRGSKSKAHPCDGAGAAGRIAVPTLSESFESGSKRSVCKELEACKRTLQEKIDANERIAD